MVEPDMGNSWTAIGLEPTRDRSQIRKTLANLPLLTEKRYFRARALALEVRQAS